MLIFKTGSSVLFLSQMSSLFWLHHGIVFSTVFITPDLILGLGEVLTVSLTTPANGSHFFINRLAVDYIKTNCLISFGFKSGFGVGVLELQDIIFSTR